MASKSKQQVSTAKSTGKDVNANKKQAANKDGMLIYNQLII